MDSYRNRKIKGPSLLDELKDLKMLEEGETVEINDVEYEDLIEENAKSVVVRGLNRTAHKVGALIKALPPIWGIEDRVQGRGVGDDRVQFHFVNESDLYHVLHRGPWFVNGWLVAVDQWKASPNPDYLKKILFWVRVKGIPVHLLKEQVVETVVENMGKVESIELHAKNSNSVEYVRARIWINTEEPLQFLKTVVFKHGEKFKVEFTYEKLLKICFKCKRLSHDIQHCPFNITAPEKRDSRRKLSNQHSKRTEAQEKRKGKGIMGSERQPVVRGGTPSVRISEGKSVQAADSKSAFERLQWTSLGRKRSGSGTEAEWRIKITSSRVRSEEETSKSSEKSKNSEGPGLLVYKSRKRRQSGGEDSVSKRAKRGNSGEKSISPSVFMRLGNSGEQRRYSEEGSGDIPSVEKSKSSPSVFDRLGSQASSSSPRVKSNSDHSVHVTAQVSNHSASSEAAQVSLSSGSLSAKRIATNKKEGLMVNSNPSSQQ